MVDNFDIIRPLLKWRSDDDFYFLQILQRKKDAKKGMKVNGTNNNSRLIKAYYIRSQEHFDFVKPEVIKLCELFNARAGINLNRRSFYKMALQHLKKVTDQIINKDHRKAYKAYSSVVGAYANESDKKWILDIDEKLTPQEVVNLSTLLTHLRPEGSKFISLVPSKSGEHWITSPFDLGEFRKTEWAKTIEVHKNNPTNCYIP